jgi:hypothetical protein
VEAVHSVPSQVTEAYVIVDGGGGDHDRTHALLVADLSFGRVPRMDEHVVDVEQLSAHWPVGIADKE